MSIICFSIGSEWHVRRWAFAVAIFRRIADVLVLLGISNILRSNKL